MSDARILINEIAVRVRAHMSDTIQTVRTEEVKDILSAEQRPAMSDSDSLPSSMASSASSSSSITIPSSANSSRRGSLSSSRPEFRPVHTEIIKRNLVKEFLTSCSYKEKRTTTKTIQKKLDRTLSVFNVSWILDQEEEDDLDPELSDILGEKKREKEKGSTKAENDMLFDIDV